jgi:hypothetical protein
VGELGINSTTTTQSNVPVAVGAWGLYTFQASQVIDGQTVTCSSTYSNGVYTECDNLQEGGDYFPNGVACGPEWSFTNSAYSDTYGFCASLTSPSLTAKADSYFNCSSGFQTRATWYSHVWSTTSDNGYTQHVRCYY